MALLDGQRGGFGCEQKKNLYIDMIVRRRLSHEADSARRMESEKKSEDQERLGMLLRVIVHLYDVCMGSGFV